MEWKHVQCAFSSASWARYSSALCSGEMYYKKRVRESRDNRHTESNTTNVTLEVDWLHEYAMLDSIHCCVCTTENANVVTCARVNVCSSASNTVSHGCFGYRYEKEVLPIANISILWKPTPIKPAWVGVFFSLKFFGRVFSNAKVSIL